MSKKHGFGWIPDVPDFRDNAYKLTAGDLRAAGISAPRESDLRPDMPPVWDQGSAGSCTGFAGNAVWWHRRRCQGDECFIPSHLLTYYNARLIAGWQKYDSGATIRDTMKVLGRWGACSETLWPYDISKLTAAPPRKAYREAERFQSKIYRRVDRDLDVMRLCLSDNRPIIFGFAVYESFISEEVASTGYVPMPQKGERLLGGHASVEVGHIDAEQVKICRNSWGPDWGDGGYFYMPYDFFTNPDLSDDFWTLDLVE